MRAFYRSFVCASAAIVLSMAFGATARADYVSAVQALNPLCYYQFNDASSTNGSVALDSAAGGHNGTYVDGAGLTAITLGPGPSLPGLSGTAAYFNNGSGGSGFGLVTCPNSELPVGDASRTIVYWEKGSTANTDGGWHVNYRYGTGWSDNGKDCFGAVVGGTNAQGFGDWGYTFNTSLVNGGPSADTNWHMLALTITNTSAGYANWAAYIDGAFATASSENPLPTITQLGTALYIGGYNGDNGFAGGIDEFSVFNGALTSDQIAGLYSAAVTPVPEPSTLALLAGGLFGLLAYAWRKRK